jgi:hypothetical protein
VVQAQNMSKGKYDWKIIGHEFSKIDVKDMVDPLIKQRTFSYFETFWLCKGNCDKFNLSLEDEHFYILSWGWLMGHATGRAIWRLASQESPRIEDKRTGFAWRAGCANSRLAFPPGKAGAGQRR